MSGCCVYKIALRVTRSIIRARQVNREGSLSLSVLPPLYRVGSHKRGRISASLSPTHSGGGRTYKKNYKIGGQRTPNPPFNFLKRRPGLSGGARWPIAWGGKTRTCLGARRWTSRRGQPPGQRAPPDSSTFIGNHTNSFTRMAYCQCNVCP